MEIPKETAANAIATSDRGSSGDSHRSAVVELPLGDASASFDLEKAVCSHGLFMMAPNHWNPLSKTFQRPLRLNSNRDDGDAHVSCSHVVRISHPSDTPHFLHIEVFDTDFLSPQQEQSLLAQVRRMLRLSEAEERNVREFQAICGEAKERGFGRVFRSPTLFEDMVKCILLCNCQWSRTLSMARALCDLQLEMHHPSSIIPVAEPDGRADSKSPTAETEHFFPVTPAGKESNRKVGVHKNSRNLSNTFAEVKAEKGECAGLRMDCAEMSDCMQGIEKLSSSTLSSNNKEAFDKHCDDCHTSTEIYKVDSFSFFDPESSEGMEPYSHIKIGNFPSPIELVSLGKKLLAKRCNLGYRASRILNLAHSVVEGRISLRQLEEASNKPSLSNYNILAEQLKELDGFGPFTCANVLMCMGFYHVIPTDSETIRHLKQVHARDSTIQTSQRDVQLLYGKYAPFQFLAYWSEVWHFYEERFGKLSEMPHSDYKLITATNMRTSKNKKIKIS